MAPNAVQLLDMNSTQGVLLLVCFVLVTHPWLCARSLQWRHNGRDSVSNHQPHDCLLNRLFKCRSKETSKLRVTGLCAGNSPGTGGFPAQMASNAENVSIWWRRHDKIMVTLVRSSRIRFYFLQALIGVETPRNRWKLPSIHRCFICINNVNWNYEKPST